MLIKNEKPNITGTRGENATFVSELLATGRGRSVCLHVESLTGYRQCNIMRVRLLNIMMSSMYLSSW